MPPRSLARSLRHNSSLTERKLWALLRDRRLDGLKFRRQVRLGPYIVDFLCLGRRLVVEAAGPFHDAERDAARDAWLESQGLRVLRFTNARIELWPDEVLDRIRETVGIAPVLSGALGPGGQV